MIADFSENSQNKMMVNGLADNFECKECKKTFKYDSHYKRHIQTHSDTRPFECDVCGKKFKRQDALKTHERTHSDDLPFKCSQEGCIESFASKAALRYHELRHQNETVFICEKDGCNKKFLTLGQLKQHQRTKIHAKSSGGAGAQQMYVDLDSQSHVQPGNNHVHSLSNSGNLSTNTGYTQNQIYYNSAATPCIQFSQPQHFYNLQNQVSPNFLYNNNTNLIQSMSDYISNETYSTNSRAQSQNNVSVNTTVNQPIINVKKEHRQEDTFLDEFSEDEQVFIDQIWSTIKQEGTNSECEFNKRQDEFNDSCNNDFHNDYPIQKCRQLNPSQTDNKIALNPSTSNLLMEFTRLNSSGYSFSRLKQELRIIVGLIDKIKKEDEEIVPPAPQSEDNQEFSNYSPNHQLDNNVNNSIHNTKGSNKSVQPKSDEDQDYHFYQNDESPFHNYECQYIQNDIPSEVVGKLDKEDSNSINNMNGYNNKGSDRPLLKKKIKTAVRLVQYCKKVFIEQKKQQIQSEQQQLQPQLTKKRTSAYSQNQYAVAPIGCFEQLPHFDITPKYEETSQPQEKQLELTTQFNNNNNFSGIQYVPIEDYYPQQLTAQSKNHILNQSFIQNKNRYSTTVIQQQGFNQQSTAHNFGTTINSTYNNNNNFYNPQNITNYSFDPNKTQQQQMVIQDNSPICINSFNNTVIDNSQRNLSDIDSIHSNDIPGNIFAADEQQNNLLFNEDFMNINQFLPPQQFNNIRYTPYEQR